MPHKIHHNYDHHGNPYVAGQAQKAFQNLHILQALRQRFIDEIEHLGGAERLQIRRKLIELFALAYDLCKAVDHITGTERGDKRGNAQKLHD